MALAVRKDALTKKAEIVNVIVYSGSTEVSGYFKISCLLSWWKEETDLCICAKVLRS